MDAGTRPGERIFPAKQDPVAELMSAILEHAGEAEGSKDAVMALSEAAREDLSCVSRKPRSLQGGSRRG